MPVLPAPDRPTHELPGARFTTLATPLRGSTETSVWMLVLDAGAEPVPHRVTREEVFVALEGEPAGTLDGVAHTVRAGQTLALQPDVQFTLAATGPTPFRALVC